MKTTTVIIMVAALLAGLVAAFMVRSLVGRSKEAVGTKLVVAAKNLNYGSSVTADDLQEIAWSSSEVPEGAFQSIAEIVKNGEQSRYLIANVAKSTPIVATQLTSPGQKPSLAAMIADGKTAVTVRVDDVRGVAGFIMPGDHVDVALTRTDEATHEGYVDTILRNLKVLAIDQVTKERQDTAQIAKSVTLEATSIEAEKLRLASEVGTLSLTLRHADDNNAADVGRITTTDLSAADMDKNKKAKGSDKSKNGNVPRISKIRIIKAGRIEETSVLSE